jgi:hypothetical protein
MIQEIVSFFGAHGHRHADILFVASCIMAPYVVDFFKESDLFKTEFYATEEEAEAAAMKFAFESEQKDA